MIGSIDGDRDIVVYLTPEDCRSIGDGGIPRGVLIKNHRPKLQGHISASIDGVGCRKNGGAVAGIGVWDNGEHRRGQCGNFELSLLPGVFFEFMERGVYGGRYGTGGSKVTLRRTDALERTQRINMEGLEWYHEKRDELPDEMG